MNWRAVLDGIGSLGSSFERDRSLPDGVTRDEKLRSLRRFKQELVDEPREKRFLERAVREELRRRDRAFLSGGPDDRSILREDRTILDGSPRVVEDKKLFFGRR